jgi:hypothetical protein
VIPLAQKTTVTAGLWAQWDLGASDTGKLQDKIEHESAAMVYGTTGCGVVAR